MIKCILPFLLISFEVFSQDVPIIKYNDLERVIHSPDGEIRIINFWATWCAPCVNELPLFEKIDSPGVEIVLINLDFVDKIDRVKTFVGRKNIKNKVLLLDEIDYNSWIDKVDKSWSGAIPATLFVNVKTGKRKFVGRELLDGDIERIIAEIKN